MAVTRDAKSSVSKVTKVLLYCNIYDYLVGISDHQSSFLPTFADHSQHTEGWLSNVCFKRPANTMSFMWWSLQIYLNSILRLGQHDGTYCTVQKVLYCLEYLISNRSLPDNDALGDRCAIITRQSSRSTARGISLRLYCSSVDRQRVTPIVIPAVWCLILSCQICNALFDHYSGINILLSVQELVCYSPQCYGEIDRRNARCNSMGTIEARNCQ